MAAATWAARTLYAAAKLGLADQLSSGPKSAAEIAAPMHAHAPSLHRLMRTLASLGIDTLFLARAASGLLVSCQPVQRSALWKRCWLEQVAINGLTHRGKQHLYSIILSAAREKIGGHDSSSATFCD
jgi:hypothetical protein